jgi:ParB/RepB/Spo0J family partition protein
MATASDIGGLGGGVPRRRLGKGLSSLMGTPVRLDAPLSSGGGTGAPISNGTVEVSGTGGGRAGEDGSTDLRRRGEGQWHGEGQGREEVGGRRLVMVGVDEVVASPFQARRAFDEGELEGLAASIKSAGVMQPILVRVRGGGGVGGEAPGALTPAGTVGVSGTANAGGVPETTQGSVGYELIAGERRWRAARRAGLSRVPAVVAELTDLEAAEWGVVENVQRAGLTPVEQAGAYAMLAGRFGLTQQQIAERTGASRVGVANLVRLLELEPAVQTLVEAGRLTAGHGKVLLAMPAGPARVRLAGKAAAGEWTVRQLDRLVSAAMVAGHVDGVPVVGGGGAGEYKDGAGRAAGGVGGSTGAGEGAGEGEEGAGETGEERAERRIREGERARHEAELERQISQQLGTKVKLRTAGKGGKASRGSVVVHFYSLDQFEGLMKRMGVRVVG